MSKLQKYKQKQSPYVRAVQFFHDDLPSVMLSAMLIEKVWSFGEGWGFVKNKKDRKPNILYTERYVVTGSNEFLEDGDWLILYPSGYVYREPNNRQFNATFRKVTTKRQRKK